MTNTTVPAELVSDQVFGRRNHFDNGAHNVSQRRTSKTGIAAGTNGVFTVDRYRLEHGTHSGQIRMDQTADAPAGFRYCQKIQCTTADTSVAAGEYIVYQQIIESQNLHRFLKGTSDAKTFMVSFYVKGNASATYTMEMYDIDNTRQVSKTFSVTTSWTRVEIEFPADTTGAFDNNTGGGLAVQIWLHAGSEYTGGTLSETWTSVTAANRASSSNSSILASTSNIFYTTGWQLELSDNGKATPFEHLTYAEDLAICQRYCVVPCFEGQANTGASQVQICMGSYYTDTQVEGVVHFPAQMRETPSLEVTSGTNYFVAENDSASHGFNAWSGVYGNGTLQKLIYSTGQVADSNHQGHATRLVAAHASAAVIFDADLP